MRRSLVLLALLAAPALQAQPASDAPMAVVTALFEGMRASDSTAMAATLHPEARLLTAMVGRDGIPTVRETPLPAFLVSVAAAEPGSLDERLYDVEVRMDGTMAVAWTPYRFYLNGAFSHCGVNQFTLVREGADWKILQIVDTRRREDCTME